MSPKTMYTCPDCAGKTYVTVQFSNGGTMKVACATCNGTGRVDWVEDGRYQLNRFAKDARAISAANGFDNPQSIEEVEKTATKLMLIVDECCEALHEVRKTGDKEAFGEELADILIRTVDLSHDLDIDLDTIVANKMEKNRGRGHLHGAKF